MLSGSFLTTQKLRLWQRAAQGTRVSFVSILLFIACIYCVFAQLTFGSGYGYDMGQPLDIDPDSFGVGNVGCYSTVTPSGTETADGHLATLKVHNVYWISWQASDTSTMSPTPPDLPCYTVVPVWTPGVTITCSSKQSTSTYGNAPEQTSSDHYNDLGWDAGSFYGPAVGVPVGFVFLICLCCMGSKMRKDRMLSKRAKQRQRERAAQGGNDVAGATGGAV
jgi:hypothetical protein